MTTMLGFAIVGCGMIARFHAKALAEIPGTRIAALVSRSGASATALLHEMNLPPCPVFGTIEEALTAPGVDCVIITTPSGAHAEPAIAAAKAGKHVVVEKPLEITGERCQRIIDACDEFHVKLCTIFPSRFGDANIAVKKAIDAGKFGRLTLGETSCKWWRSQAYYDDGGWKGTQALDGGGALMNQAIHNVDLLLWMMGDVATVSGFTATLAHERIEVEDTATAILRFKNGALGVIQATTSVHPGYPKTIAIHGDRGSAVIEQDDVLKWDFTPPDDSWRAGSDSGRAGSVSDRSVKSGGAADPKAISHEGHRRQLADFVQAIRTNTAPQVDGREGKKAVELIRAIYESQATGRIVELSH
jgi:UDP-N-acetyl-2-amino-2-deoxyglucuronate dehydrogenase